MTFFNSRTRGAVAALALAMAFVLSGGAKAQTNGPQIKDDWFDYEIRWDEGAPSDYAKWYILVADRGALAVCGAAFHSGQPSANRKIMKASAVFLGDEVLLEDLRFFTKVNRRRSLVGANSTCVATGRNIADFTSREAGIKGVGPMRRY